MKGGVGCILHTEEVVVGLGVASGTESAEAARVLHGGENRPGTHGEARAFGLGGERRRSILIAEQSRTHRARVLGRGEHDGLAGLARQSRRLRGGGHGDRGIADLHGVPRLNGEGARENPEAPLRSQTRGRRGAKGGRQVGRAYESGSGGQQVAGARILRGLAAVPERTVDHDLSALQRRGVGEDR